MITTNEISPNYIRLRLFRSLPKGKAKNHTKLHKSLPSNSLIISSWVFLRIISGVQNGGYKKETWLYLNKKVMKHLGRHGKD